MSLVIELPPNASSRILYSADVVALLKRMSNVLQYPVSIVTIGRCGRQVDLSFLIWYGGLPSDDKVVHIEAVQWEINGCMDLLGSLKLGRCKALEMDDEELRQPCEDDLFRSFSLAFAVRTTSRALNSFSSLQ